MRRLFTIASAVSFVLLSLLCAFWVRSFWSLDGFVHFKAGGEVQAQVNEMKPETVDGKQVIATRKLTGLTYGRFAGLVSKRGKLSFVSVRVPFDKGPTWQGFSDSLSEPKSTPAKATINAVAPGTSIGSATAHFVDTDLLSKHTYDWNVPCWRLTVPYAALVILAAVLPDLWIARFRLLSKREREGLCLECGHDIKGRKGKCASCGAEIPAEE
jgi:hypothetical protein